MQICAACDHSNTPARGYCAACGHMLRLVCRSCRFANDHGDRFCGGCGLSLLMPAVARTVAGGKSSAASATSAELDELFAASSAMQDDMLPASGVTQDDLDRLFGARVRQ